MSIDDDKVHSNHSAPYCNTKPDWENRMVTLEQTVQSLVTHQSRSRSFETSHPTSRFSSRSKHIKTANSRGPSDEDYSSSSPSRKCSRSHSSDEFSSRDDRCYKRLKKKEPKGCSYQNFVACKPNEFKGERSVAIAMKWLEEVESILKLCDCTKENLVNFATQLLEDDAFYWWKTIIASRAKDPDYVMGWEEFVEIFTKRFCPESEMEKIEAEFLQLTMKGLEVQEFTTKFNELSRLVPHLVTPEDRRISRYIYALSPEIQGLVRAAGPTTYEKAVDLAYTMTDFAKRSRESKVEIESNKGKESKSKSHNFKKKKLNSRKEIPQCCKCGKHHYGKCSKDKKAWPCGICNHFGHKTLECKRMKDAICHRCGEKGHIKPSCAKGKGENVKEKKGNA
jgi:hypothetical protein